MMNECVFIEQSLGLQGEVSLVGAKNAVLVIMASLILTSGVSRLTNVPASDDVYQMIALLRDLGAIVSFDAENQTLIVNTATLSKYQVSPEIMRKMRASVLVMGPLLARFGKAAIALPGGCVIGDRPVDLHVRAFARMGAEIDIEGHFLTAYAQHGLTAQRIVLDYPSVGATENIMMGAVFATGTTTIVNAAIEPEVLDLVDVLVKMGAQISILPLAIIEIKGVLSLSSVEHAVMADRLEAGTLLLAAAVTRGSIVISDAPAASMEVFLEKLSEMGHVISVGPQGVGISLEATASPQAVSFKTMPYPGFPTDLQAPMMVAQCLASGTSIIHETVYENRLLHVRELQKMGAQIVIEGNNMATIKGVEQLYGAAVIAPDIRGSAALIIAGLAARGKTTMTGVHHLRRGYQSLDRKLAQLGARIKIV